MDCPNQSQNKRKTHGEDSKGRKWWIFYSTTLKQEICIIQNPDSAIEVHCKDGTNYNARECSMLYKHNVGASEIHPIPLEIHLLKKMFNGVIEL